MLLGVSVTEGYLNGVTEEMEIHSRSEIFSTFRFRALLSTFLMALPPLPDEDTITDEELDAELEKLQQNITLTLQDIDQNFERCNQIVTGQIIPEVDKFTQASRDIWERSKVRIHIEKTRLLITFVF